MKGINLQAGRIVRVAGPVVAATGLEGIRLHDVVRVGAQGLVGEVIRLVGDLATVQVYEDTAGLRFGEQVLNTGQPLVVHLGPGLLGRVYDGLQRPLTALAEISGDFIDRGIDTPPLPDDLSWTFTPCVEVGAAVRAGELLGTIPESSCIEHRVMVPPGIHGRVTEIRQGDFSLHEVVARIDTRNDGADRAITLCQQWPIRTPRPNYGRLPPYQPLVTGTRVIDLFFPMAKGGTAIIPGGFGTGKTVTEHSLARWADVDVVVYVGCGERGNEMTEVLEDFPTLKDPRTGASLMERTVLIANTSNMPVAAREASIYTGITIAEYYRDMGYDVLMLADSTSRWGEALREISCRLEEMPGEEGYPAYLAARLAEFYERAGRVTTRVVLPAGGATAGVHHTTLAPSALPSISKGEGGDGVNGSVTIVGAVSPPGGDFSEPMTQSSMRIAGTFWALDYALSRQRHFPAINWTRSYSLYDLQGWYTDNVATDWQQLTTEAMALLQRETELLEIVRLVGPDALAAAERTLLAVARMLREDLLHQSAYHPVDRFCPPEKSYWMLKVIVDFRRWAGRAVEDGVPLETVMARPLVTEIARMKEIPVDESVDRLQALQSRVESELGVP